MLLTVVKTNTKICMWPCVMKGFIEKTTKHFQMRWKRPHSKYRKGQQYLSFGSLHDITISRFVNEFLYSMWL